MNNVRNADIPGDNKDTSSNNFLHEVSVVITKNFEHSVSHRSVISDGS